MTDPPGCAGLAGTVQVRARELLTRVGSEHEVRIKDLVRQLMPMTPLTGDLGKSDLVVLKCYAYPERPWLSGRLSSPA